MKENATRVFIVEDDNFFATMLRDFLVKKRFNNVEVYHSGEDCLNHLHHQPEIVILDYKLGKMSGLDVLRKIKSVNPNIQVIFLSAQEKMTVAVKALRYGAYDYIEKGSGNLERLGNMVKRILQHNQLALENQSYRRFKKYFFAIMAAAIATLVYLGIEFPYWFES